MRFLFFSKLFRCLIAWESEKAILLSNFSRKFSLDSSTESLPDFITTTKYLINNIVFLSLFITKDGVTSPTPSKKKIQIQVGSITDVVISIKRIQDRIQYGTKPNDISHKNYTLID